jgi:tRNA(Arg) A34 adenosine deaminase TadA
MNEYIIAAAELAAKSKYKHQMGAVVVYGGKIVGRGFNYAHSTGRPYGDGVHAEMKALNNTTAKFRDGCTIYVCRGSDVNNLKLAKPCTACQSIMRKLGVKYAWYSTGEEPQWAKMEL